MAYSKDRKMIIAHLELSHKVHKRACKIFLNKRNKDLIHDVSHDIEFSALKLKLNILQQKDDYLKEKSKFNEAINDFVFNNIPLENAARKNGIDDLLSLLKESVKCLRLKLNNKTYTYEYDKFSEKDEVFTFVEETLLLKELRCWAEKANCQCPCQVCAMEQLQNIAYRFAWQEKKCPQIWSDHKKADLSWLYNFIIKNTEEISNFKTANKCNIDSRASQSSSSISNAGEISETITSQSDLPDDGPWQVKDDITESMNKRMRQKIKEHLKVSKKLDEAAKTVFKTRTKKDIINKTADKFKLDYLVLKTKINILQLRKETYQRKYKRESALYDIIFNRISTASAVRQHTVDQATLTMEITEWLKSESGIYVYDELTSGKDTGIFTYSEEFVLLKQLLRLNPEDLNRNCNCRICLLEHLSKLAYKFAKEHNKLCPSEWNRHEKADVNWLLDFEMRHSIEINKDTREKCLAEKSIT